jgi:hypothetical protein
MAVRRTAAGLAFVLATMLAAPGCGDSPTGSSAPMDDPLSLSVTSATLEPGQSLKIEATAAGAVQWESSDPSVVEVSPTGVVAAHREGDAQITAHSSGKVAQAKVKVKKQPTSPDPTDPEPTPIEPAPTPAEPAVGSNLVYGHDFDDGTTGELGQWGGYTARPVSVIADPTGSGRGGVAKVAYERDPSGGGSVDVNGGMYFRPNPAGGHPSGVGFGDSIYFRADLWFPRYPGGRPDRPHVDQRKLLYLKFGESSNRSSSLVLNSWGRTDGSGLDLALVSERTAGDAESNYGLGGIGWETWHRIEMQLIVNHRGVADGVVRVWLDGRLVKERRGVVIFDPSASTATDYIYEWGIGNQEQWSADEKVPMKDFRMWDNVEFRTGRP